MTEGTLVFRDLRQRNLEDQKKAAAEGYNGVLEMAVNELGRRVIEMEQRMERVEKHMGLTSFVKERYKDPELTDAEAEDATS